MKKKIIIYYLMLLVIGLLVTGIFTFVIVQRSCRLEIEDRLKSTAYLIAHQAQKEIRAGRTVDYNLLAGEYASVLKPEAASMYGGLRITIVNFQGTVIGETDADYRLMQNHLQRKEISEALQEGLGTDVHLSRTLDAKLLYVAVPFRDQGVIIRISVPMTQLNEINRVIFYYITAGILLALLSTIFLAVRFSASITRPVQDLISVSREIARGNYARRVRTRSGDELGQLACTFNEMAENLENTVYDLTDKSAKVDSIMNSIMSGIIAVDRHLKILLVNDTACEIFGVTRDNNTIGSNFIQLIRNNKILNSLKETIKNNVSLLDEIYIGLPSEKALRIYTNPIMTKDLQENLGGIVFIQDITRVRKLEQIRTEFVSNVTHELKTPLTSIRGFIETLKSGAIMDEKVSARFLDIIDIEAERLTMLIEDILQLSEIESKHMDTNLGSHNLSEIILESISILQSTAANKEISLFNGTVEDISIYANRDRIKQMLINLIDNGIKYNIKGGSVTVSASMTSGTVDISVRDTGIGIEEEHIPRIFERFYRVDKGRSRDLGGTGLGLSIVKHIVNLYNGDIKVYSSPGEGTEFVVSLPV